MTDSIRVNPFMLGGYLKSLDRSISSRMVFWLVLFSCFVEISERNANIVDPDQTPRSEASDQGLHCLSVSLFWDVRLKWVKNQ